VRFHTGLRAFTTRSTGIVRELINEIDVCEAYAPGTGRPAPVRCRYKAVWDTGATGTLISQKIAQELNLQPSGRENVIAVGPGGQSNTYETNTYLVNIYLPNEVGIVGVRVGEGEIAGGDVLLGMDIIAFGDFTITNYNGQTWWSFRTPPNEGIDFVEEINEYYKRPGMRMASLSPEERQRQRNRDKKGRQKHRRK
jgi:predicted aspartyl protease